MYLVPVYICEIGIIDVNWSQHIHLPYRLLKFEEKNSLKFVSVTEINEFVFIVEHCFLQHHLLADWR